MSVVAMRVTAAEAHPNADTLRIYTFEAPQRPTLQVVANMENVYQIGDVVAVAQVGAKLLDGTRIRRSKLRGAESLGMAMGITEEPVGTDLSALHCAPDEPQEATPDNGLPADLPVVKWTSIELLHNVLRNLEARREFLGEQFVYPRVAYRAKIKLDGTNGGIHILPSGEVVAQSRSRLLTVGDDNIGFAAWVAAQEAYFQALKRDQHIILFGEWCGQGIQKRTAISKIDRKIFAVFAIQFGDPNAEESHLEIEPARIQAILPEHPEIFVLPWMGDELTFDFGDRDQLQASADRVNQMVDEAENVDPWVAERFGIEGIGEGVVMYPLIEGYDKGPILRESCTELMYKAKGEKHQAVKQKKSVQLDPEVAQSIDAFATMFLTDARLEQAVQEGCSGAFEFAKMSDFLKWIGQDVKKEADAELEASGLEWKDVSKAIMNGAKSWYKAKIEAVV